MHRRRRADSAASKDLLSRQLASITDTLAKASQRRDAELKKAQRSAEVSPETTGPASLSEPAVSVNKTRSTPAAAQIDATATTARDLRARRHATGYAKNFNRPAAASRTYGTSDVGDDATAMLGEPTSLRDDAYMSDIQSDDDGNDDIKRMLVELDKSASPPLTIAVASTNDDPRQMLAELAEFPVTDCRGVSSFTNKHENDDEDDDDINTLRMRLQNLRSDFGIPLQMATRNHHDLDETTSHCGQDETVERLSAPIDPEILPYIIALELEHSRTQWEYAQGWTTHLYSSGSDSYEAHKDREIAIKRAEEALRKIVCSVLEAEESSRREEEERMLHKRLVVSNLAASADVQELERLFHKQHFEIANIDLLPDRDPLRRTQTAHIDMSSRKAAIQASYMTGQIYGLIVHVRLAVEQDV